MFKAMPPWERGDFSPWVTALCTSRFVLGNWSIWERITVHLLFDTHHSWNCRGFSPWEDDVVLAMLFRCEDQGLLFLKLQVQFQCSLSQLPWTSSILLAAWGMLMITSQADWTGKYIAIACDSVGYFAHLDIADSLRSDACCHSKIISIHCFAEKLGAYSDTKRALVVLIQSITALTFDKGLLHIIMEIALIVMWSPLDSFTHAKIFSTTRLLSMISNIETVVLTIMISLPLSLPWDPGVIVMYDLAMFSCPSDVGLVLKFEATIDLGRPWDPGVTDPVLAMDILLVHWHFVRADGTSETCLVAYSADAMGYFAHSYSAILNLQSDNAAYETANGLLGVIILTRQPTDNVKPTIAHNLVHNPFRHLHIQSAVAFILTKNLLTPEYSGNKEVHYKSDTYGNCADVVFSISSLRASYIFRRGECQGFKQVENNTSNHKHHDISLKTQWSKEEALKINVHANTSMSPKNCDDKLAGCDSKSGALTKVQKMHRLWEPGGPGANACSSLRASCLLRGKECHAPSPSLVPEEHKTERSVEQVEPDPI